MPHTKAETLLDLTKLSKEEHLQLAIKAIEASGVDRNGVRRLSASKAAAIYKVSKTTLLGRMSGAQQERREAHEHEQALSSAQEEVLVTWIKVCGRRGIPLTHATVRDYASLLAEREVGQSWSKRFLECHSDLKIHWTSRLEHCRARALNATLVPEFFDVLLELMIEYKIPPENIYNMDEKGVLLGIGGRIAAFTDRDQKVVYQIDDGD